METALQNATHPMVPEPVRILRVRKETQDTFTIETEPVKGKHELAFRPGQFDLLYAFGVGEAPISISGDPANTGVRVHTIRGVGSVTRTFQNLKKGDVIGLRGPYGSSWPVEKAEGNDVVVIAGGVGLAPVRPVIYHLLAHREKFGNVFILYGARNPDELLFKKELLKWRGRFDLDVKVTVDTAQRGWMGNVGVVPQLIQKAKFDPESSIAMICGPEVMMRFTVKELLGEGIDDQNIFITMERNMRCAVGFCGHCQFGPQFICKDGPVFPYAQVRSIFNLREI